MPPTPSARLPWVDHLRTLVILLVVNMHACVTYSHVGSWYAMSEREPSFVAKIPFIIWQAHLQSFFMGLLFFVSGYFAHGSLARRGPASFARERLLRLGAPTLLYMLAIHPFILLVLNPWHAHFPPAPAFYSNYLLTGKFIGSTGPLWFALALLIFSLVLVAWRALRPPPAAASPATSPAPSACALWLFALSLGLIALFSKKLNRETIPLRWLADRSFAVYVLHAPVIIALFMLYRALPQNPFALAALLTFTGLVAAFALADLARRVPGLRAIL